jgi:fatty acid/phospholipid biosynthesis enzyme
VGLLSNGEEEGKGNALVRAATPLIKHSGVNFYGNVEGKEVIGGLVDVAVTDGSAGTLCQRGVGFTRSVNTSKNSSRSIFSKSLIKQAEKQIVIRGECR